MEDITSSKTPAQLPQPSLYSTPAEAAAAAAADDSDADSATLNSSISDDFNEAAAHTGGGGGIRWKRRTAHNADGESDSDADLLDISFDSDAFVMKKSFDALRSAADASKRGSLLGKLGRRVETAEWPNSVRKRHSVASQSSKQPVKGSSKDNEIESGVEITEEMSLPTASAVTTTTAPPLDAPIANDDTSDDDLFVDVIEDPPKSIFLWLSVRHLRELPNKRALVFYIILILGCWWYEVPPFVQGALTCLCSMSIVQAIWQLVQLHLSRYLNERFFGVEELSSNNRRGPERVAFAVPDYANMEPLVMSCGGEATVGEMADVPVVVEQQPAIKSYEVCFSFKRNFNI